MAFGITFENKTNELINEGTVGLTEYAVGIQLERLLNKSSHL